MSNELDEYLEEKSSSMVKMTKQQKISRATGALAVGMAKKKGDPAYTQMIKYKTLYIKFKEKITAKYGPRVRSQARK